MNRSFISEQMKYDYSDYKIYPDIPFSDMVRGWSDRTPVNNI